MHKNTIFFLLFLSVSTLSPKMIEQLELFRKSEEIDNKRYFIREERVNGVVNREWRIDGTLVSEEDFYERKMKALEQEMIHERENSNLSNLQKLQEENKARLSILKKLALQTVDSIKNSIEKISKPALKEFLQWKPETIASLSEFKQLQDTILPKTDDMLKQEELEDLERLELYIKKIEELNTRLNQLYNQSLTHAINKSDDPKVLKELLELI